MPQRYLIKKYRAKSWYHVYNRGAHKYPVFPEEEDGWFFREKARLLLGRHPGVKISPFCLIPNHFHFELWQKGSRDMVPFLKSLLTSYGMYFAKKYDHSGRLWQGAYKARWLATPEEQEQVRLYILNNAQEAGLVDWPHVGNEI